MNDVTEESGKPAPSAIPPEELQRILAEHRRWLASGGKQGEQANLQGAGLGGADLKGAFLFVADLQGAFLDGAKLQGADVNGANLKGAFLGGANLQGANLGGANLQGASLVGANLQGAGLGGADLQGASIARANFEKCEIAESGDPSNLPDRDLPGADLTRTNFRDADLSDAQLATVSGLLPERLAGTNLANSKLPADIAKFEGAAHVGKISEHAGKTFIAVLLGCVYSWLTIAITTDARLVTNSASSPLPIVGTEIPIVGFYWATPTLLLAMYLYLHLYLQRLWTELAGLPAIFPDGIPLYEKIEPWLLNGLVRAHFTRLRRERPFDSYLQNGVSIVLAWWVVPFTLAAFWLRYLPKHDWSGTGFQVMLLAIAVRAALGFHALARRTLRGGEPKVFRWERPWRGFSLHRSALAFGIAAAFALISLGAIEGVPPSLHAYGAGPAQWVPKIFASFGYRAAADLHSADLSTKPSGYTGLPEKTDAEIAQVKPAFLAGADLRHAKAAAAFLAKADLSRANLKGASFVKANLKGAILEGANLQGANFEGANLQGATLGGGNLQGAGFSRANLQGAWLGGADLQGANLNQANLQGAIFGGANLKGTNLSGANLEVAILSGANLEGANLSGASLQGAILSGVILQGAWLYRASLQGANLDRANLQGANLVEANLQGARLNDADVTQEQLDRACGDEGTILPPGLKIKSC